MTEQSNSDKGGLPFRFQQQSVPTGAQERSWRKIEASINTAPTVRFFTMRLVILAVAASLLLVAGVLWLFRYTYTGANTLYQTTYAQVKNIRLPDGSRVVLNANSSLRLTADWSEQGDRQVWLEGEAYFEVEKKMTTRTKFIVHTNDLDVEVLGTRFNVNTRRKGAVVALEEGRIKLIVKKAVHNQRAAAVHPEAIEMKPGDVVKLDTIAGIQHAGIPHVEYHSGWVRKEFHFNNTSLKEIANLIRDIYGYGLVVEEEELLQRSVTGNLRAENLQELLDVLQLTLRLKMTIQQKNIIVSRL